MLEKGFKNQTANKLYGLDWGSDILHDVTELVTTAAGKTSTANRKRYHDQVQRLSDLGDSEESKYISELDIGHDLADVAGDINSLGRTQMSDVQTWNSLSSNRDRAIKDLEEIMDESYQERRRETDGELMDDVADYMDLVFGRSRIDPVGLA